MREWHGVLWMFACFWILAACGQADLVLLSKNPLKVDPETIKEIAVLKTFAHGKRSYDSSAARPRTTLDE